MCKLTISAVRENLAKWGNVKVCHLKWRNNDQRLGWSERLSYADIWGKAFQGVGRMSTKVGGVVSEGNRSQFIWGLWDKLSTLDFILSEMRETNGLFWSERCYDLTFSEKGSLGYFLENRLKRPIVEAVELVRSLCQWKRWMITIMKLGQKY